ncbi:MAG: CpaF family protein [Candidatus Omnitrophica bacterium]|jgi:pilus assembly protein CpaF|nr:CpaF family protein [Candidatus Omnitrophota bacterium]
MVDKLKEKIKEKIITQYRGLLSTDSFNNTELREKIIQVAEDVLDRERNNLSSEEKIKIINELVNELTGFGPIESLFEDQAVTEIMINGPDKIYAEKGGKTELTGLRFDNEAQLMYMINKMLAPTRRHVDESFPYTEICLKDGSRVNIIIPPLALDGPAITIRKFLKEIKTVEDLLKLGTLDERMSEFFIAAIKAKINIIFSGATGVGKTTTLNVLSGHIPNEERVVTIEDTAELHLIQDHVVRLESRQSNIEGRGEITIRDLFKNSLRMRPDRIIIGEIRGSEALDMLQAICSGHKGSLVVLHANSPQDVIYRLETMILTSGIAINLEAIHRQIATAINLIVQQEQLLDGSRKITHVTQVNGLKNGQVVLEDIFIYELTGVDANNKPQGRWKATGIIPCFWPLFEKSGIKLSNRLFNKD